MSIDPNRKRAPNRSKAELLAEARARVAKLEAQINGTFEEKPSESLTHKLIRRTLRKRETLLKNAPIELVGVVNPETGKIEKKPLSDRIERAQKTVQNLLNRKAMLEGFEANLPFDIAELKDAVKRIDAGETVPMPDGLHPIPGETQKTDTDIEIETRDEIEAEG